MPDCDARPEFIPQLGGIRPIVELGIGIDVGGTGGHGQSIGTALLEVMPVPYGKVKTVGATTLPQALIVTKSV